MSDCTHASFGSKRVLVTGGASSIDAAIVSAFAGHEIAATMGGLDILVNNAASDDRHAIAEMTPAYWDECIASDRRHLFFAAQAAVPHLSQTSAFGG